MAWLSDYRVVLSEEIDRSEKELTTGGFVPTDHFDDAEKVGMAFRGQFGYLYGLRRARELLDVVDKAEAA